jgi:putative ABC transport system substrate-binding protein
MPVIGFVSPNTTASRLAAFRKGLGENGYVEDWNVTVEYHWLEGHFEKLPALMADLVRRQVTVIATPGTVPAIRAKAATATIPIVFARDTTSRPRHRTANPDFQRQHNG